MTYEDGFRAGWLTALRFMEQEGQLLDKEDAMYLTRAQMYSGSKTRTPRMEKVKRKIKQTPKQRLLTKMTKKKWDRYKKGSGKKTYVQIRAEVSRSQAFKKAARRL